MWQVRTTYDGTLERWDEFCKIVNYQCALRNFGEGEHASFVVSWRNNIDLCRHITVNIQQETPFFFNNKKYIKKYAFQIKHKIWTTYTLNNSRPVLESLYQGKMAELSVLNFSQQDESCSEMLNQSPTTYMEIQNVTFAKIHESLRHTGFREISSRENQ